MSDLALTLLRVALTRKALPAADVFNQKWGTCVAAAPEDSGSTVVTVADPCVWNGNTKIQSSQP